jgi:ribose transport system substrate-binding protein
MSAFLGRVKCGTVVLIGAVLALTSCAGAASGDGGGDATKRVAFLAAASQNGYNQAVYEGIQSKAEELGNVEATILDGEFDGEVQFNQMQDVAASGRYDGIIVVPNDSVSIAAAVQAAQDARIPVVTAVVPIGPDLAKLEPQVPGVVATVGSPLADGARRQAELVAEYCADRNPCQVMILIGILRAPYDNLRYQAYREVLDQHGNIEVVSTLEGNYDRDRSLQATQDALQSHPDVDAILSNADQQTFGAQLALEQAGIPPSSVYLTGAGGAQEAVKAVRDGMWASDYLNFPVTQGQHALEQLANAMSGQQVTPVIDSDEKAPIGPFVTKEDLDANPGFTGQWSG